MFNIQQRKSLSLFTGILGSTTIALGALGAHGFNEYLTSIDGMASYKVATLYGLIHSVALLAVQDKKEFFVSGMLWFIGTVLFSGSILLLLADQAWGLDLSFLAPVTPLGGVVMILGWVRLIFRR